MRFSGGVGWGGQWTLFSRCCVRVGLPRALAVSFHSVAQWEGRGVCRARRSGPRVSGGRGYLPTWVGLGLGTWVGLGCSKCDAHAVTVAVKCPFSLCWQRHVFHALLAAAQHSALAMAATGPQQSWMLEPRGAARKTGSRDRSVSG